MTIHEIHVETFHALPRNREALNVPAHPLHLDIIHKITQLPLAKNKCTKHRVNPFISCGISPCFPFNHLIPV